MLAIGVSPLSLPLAITAFRAPEGYFSLAIITSCYFSELITFDMM